MAELDADMDFSAMKVNDLKKELKNRGLSVAGNKTELIERLQMSMMAGNDSDILAEATDLLEGGDEELEGGDEELEGGDDELQDDAALATELDSPEKPNELETKAAEEAAAPKKKVSIKRDSALPVVETPEPKAPKPTLTPITATVDEKKTSVVIKTITTKADPPAAEAPAADATAATETTETATETAEKPIKELSDAERAAIRAAKFGSSAVAPPAAVVGSVEKKMERAKRFGLPITSETTVGGKPSKIGAVPTADLDTLKKRAERFGQTNSNTLKKLELNEKIKKRQERFGEVKKENGGPAAKKLKVEVNKALLEPKVDPIVDEKMKKRAERFAAAASS